MASVSSEGVPAESRERPEFGESQIGKRLSEIRGAEKEASEAEAPGE